MQPDLRDTIAALDDRQTVICCRGLVILMDQHMASHPRSGRPRNLTVTDFRQWIRMGGRPVTVLLKALRKQNPEFTSAVGRRLMQKCLTWGCKDAVWSACRLIYAPVGFMGKLAPETLVAALAAIMLWHPTGPTLEALLQPEATRRFPWLRPPEPAPMAPASEEAPAARRHLEKAATARPMPE